MSEAGRLPKLNLCHVVKKRKTAPFSRRRGRVIWQWGGNVYCGSGAGVAARLRRYMIRLARSPGFFMPA